MPDCGPHSATDGGDRHAIPTEKTMTEVVNSESERRFAFGRNWRRFLPSVDATAVRDSSLALQEMLERQRLDGLTFLDIGSGSGLSSLVAFQLGARVTSFDFDSDSVACTKELRDKHDPDGKEWSVRQASILDAGIVAELGTFDIVYSWGVLHHTGHMYRAIDHAAQMVRPGGQLFIAIYNDQGWVSRYWTRVKRLWVHWPVLRPLIFLFHAPYLVGLRWLVRAATGRLRLERGMRLSYDTVDWLGGYPFEVARPELLVEMARKRGMRLLKMRTCGGRHGCNELVFQRDR